MRVITRGPNTKYGKGSGKTDKRGGRTLTSPNRVKGVVRSAFGRKVV